MKKTSKEVDLYVVNKKISKQEMQALSNFIEEYKRKKKRNLQGLRISVLKPVDFFN